MDWTSEPWDYTAEKCYWECHGEPGGDPDDEDEDGWEEEDNDWYE